MIVYTPDISWLVSQPTEEILNFVFDSIDLNQGKARMIGNNDSSDVDVDAFLEAIHFTEHTISGTRNTTSIFDKSVNENCNPLI